MLDLSDARNERIAARLRQAEYAYLITVRADGRPHCVPVCFVWEDNTVLVFSQPDAVKVRNLRQNPHVSLALDSFGQSEYLSLVVEGTAELVDEPGLDMAYPAYATKYTALSERMFGTSVPPEAFRREYAQAIRITLTRIRQGG